MSGISNFLRFDENNTNIMTDADYSASPQRQNGVGNGLADPALHNKLFHQTSIMVSALADSLASKGYTVTDNDYSGLVSILNNIALTADYPKTIDALTDVVIDNPQNKQLLTHNSTANKWENKTLSAIIGNDYITDDMIGNRTADPTTATAYTLTGSVTQFFSWIVKRFEQALGYAWGVAIPFSLKTLAEQADIGTLYIPAGGTFSPITRAGRNRTYNKIFIDCHGENPTSLVITLYHNGELIYTSPAITTDETSENVALAITGEQKVQAFTSNTTGLTKGISVSLKQVNR